MFEIYYTEILFFITMTWCLVRVVIAVKNKEINWKRELQLILVYICFIVIARYVFFPFSKVDGKIQPLIFDDKLFTAKINLIPLVHMFDYAIKREAIINFVGNVTMFIPVGIVYPIVYKGLNTYWKVIVAGVGLSLCIEMVQLPLDRTVDIDDLIMNSFGYVIGYGIYLLVGKIKKMLKSVSK